MSNGKKRMMKTWKDIQDLSARLFLQWLRGLDGEGGREVPGEMSERIARQERYDAWQAYRKGLRYRRRRHAGWWAAAAAVVCVAATGAWWFWSRGEAVEPQQVLPVVQQHAIEPGSRKAVLTLADGSVWALRDSSMMVGEHEDWQVDSVGLQVAAPDTAVPLAYNMLEVPRGGEFFLALPDGTQVWLNSETVLRFPSRFAEGVREVQLEGEAYFDVAHEEGSVFRVKMAEGVITVLGTEFCATAYPDERLAATLVEGSIAFRAQDGTFAELHPNQRLEYDNQAGKIEVQEVDPWLYTSWKEDIFCFEDRSLEDIMAVLSRWYNVQVTFEEDGLRNLRLSGTLDKYSEIEPFLRLFEAGADVKFDIRQRQIVVKKR